MEWYTGARNPGVTSNRYTHWVIVHNIITSWNETERGELAEYHVNGSSLIDVYSNKGVVDINDFRYKLKNIKLPEDQLHEIMHTFLDEGLKNRGYKINLIKAEQITTIHSIRIRLVYTLNSIHIPDDLQGVLEL